MRVFRDDNELTIHKSAKHKIGPYYRCTECKRDFSDKNKTKRHITGLHKGSSASVLKLDHQR